MHEYEQALANFNMAIHLDDTYVHAYYNRGNIYKITGDLNSAIRDYNSAIKLDNDFVEAYVNRGIAYAFHLNQFDKALSDFSTAIKLAPDDAMLYVNRAGLYLKMNELRNVIRDCNKAIKLDSVCAKAYSLRGSAYMNLGMQFLGKSDIRKGCDLGFCKGKTVKKTSTAGRKRKLRRFN